MIEPNNDLLKYDAKKNMNAFVTNLRKHFEEEELIVFPLVIRLMMKPTNLPAFIFSKYPIDVT